VTKVKFLRKFKCNLCLVLLEVVTFTYPMKNAL
jgi:hypothetical protein